MGLRNQLTFKPLQYYVYVYIDPITFEPFYVGKGKASRWRISNHLKSSNRWLHRKLKKLERLGYQTIIDIVQDNLTEDDAFIWERMLIAGIGRKDQGRGFLLNLTDGGEGVSGFQPNRIPWNKGKTLSSEHVQRMRDSLKGRKFTEEHKRKISESSRKNLGKRGSSEWRRKQRESHLGQPAWNKGVAHSVETRKKISDALRKRNKRND